MKRKKSTQPAMTLIEMLVCLAIVALCLVALVRGLGGMGLFAERTRDDAALVGAVETLLVELEGQAPEMRQGELVGGWQYETRMVDGRYTLTVYHAVWEERHDFLVREGP